MNTLKTINFIHGEFNISVAMVNKPTLFFKVFDVPSSPIFKLTDRGSFYILL